VFIMTGAVPNTRWLNGCVALDDKGFVKTGPDLSSGGLAKANWPFARPPHRSKRAARASSPSETCAEATSSASHLPSATAPSLSPLFTKSFANDSHHA
jgi:hypothetical protein